MVRAIERHESILQTNMAERIQQIQQQHPDLQQRYFQIQINQERHKLLKKPNAPDEAFEAAIGEDGGRKKQQDEQKKKAPLPVMHAEAKSESEQQSHIDIEV